jgi:TolB-like protein
MFFGWTRFSTIRLLLIGLFAASPIGAALAEGVEKKNHQTPIEVLAGELLDGFKNRNVNLKERLLTHWKGDLKVAVWPFDREPIPIPQKLAQSWNEELLNALVKGTPEGFRFVTRADLETLIKEVEGMDLTGQIKNPVAAVAEKAKVDILIIGKMLTDAGGVGLSYRAVDMSGVIIATTSKQSITLNTETVGMGKSSLAMDAAIDVATAKAIALGENLEEIRVSGIRYADSGIQTSFGRYVVELFTDNLQDKMLDVLSGNSLKVRDAKMTGSGLDKLRGLNVTAKSVEKIISGQDEGAYMLSGNYWDLGAFVRLRIVLKNSEGDGVTWSGRIHRASIPTGLQLVPSDRAFLQEDNHGYGPISLDLSSNKGHNPVFRIGEKMTLLIQASERVFLNCFYRQADGITIKFFPNRHHRDSSIAARSQFHIPSKKMGFDFNISPPAGSERITCFASDKELTKFLPPEIGQRDLEPIPPTFTQNLDRFYRSNPNVRVSEVSMAVTVQK